MNARQYRLSSWAMYWSEWPRQIAKVVWWLLRPWCIALPSWQLDLLVKIREGWVLLWAAEHFDEGFTTMKHASSILLYLCLFSITRLVDLNTAPAKWRSNAHTLSISTLCISTWAKSSGSTDIREALFFRKMFFSKWRPFTSSYLFAIFALNKSKNNLKR